MDGDDADAETVGAAVGGRDDTLVNVVPLAFRRLATVQNCHGGILDPAVVGLAVIRLDPDMVRIHRAEVNAR